MIKIDIKPLSVNDAYRGRRFATAELKQYKHDLQMLLPKIDIPKGRMLAHYRVGVSSKQCDVDNFIKAFQDCLAECYGFNDKMIYSVYICKEDVSKGKEFVSFELMPHPESRWDAGFGWK